MQSSSGSPADPPRSPWSLVTDARTDRLLYGSDPSPRIVAVELAGGRSVRLYTQSANGVRTSEVPFIPWLLAAVPEPWAGLRGVRSVTPLAGHHPLRQLVEFDSWSAFQDLARAARDAREKIFRLRSPLEQYLVRSGKTLFMGMVFDDLQRLQIDIETEGLDPVDPTSRVIVVAIRTSSGVEEVFSLTSDEAELLDSVTARIREIDPDVVEGHNLFNFDLPFLARRAERAGVSLSWGRDGSPLKLAAQPGRFKAGPLSLPYQPAYIEGRHIIDTYQQIQRYDAGGRLGSYALKNVVEELGLTRSDREFVPGEQIRDLWREDPERLLRYALDDVRDVDILSRLATPTEFYQAQLLPRSFQAVATGGPGEKINDLMLRAYLAELHSVPLAQEAREYPGGHAELLSTGRFSPVIKCDVESLYPSIMLTEGIAAESDSLQAYLPMLTELTQRRFHAKAMSRGSFTGDTSAERAMWEGMQSSFKVLINSFYGYLGYGGGLFNDYDAATKVTLIGQQIVQSLVAELRASGSTPIEVDTDGVYFVPPPDILDEASERAYVERIGRVLPPTINLAHDGRYAGMLSLRLKTYALLAEDGSLTLKGSALRSRRMEPCFQAFLRRAAHAFLVDDRDTARSAYFALADLIRQRRLPPTDIGQWTVMNEEAATKSPRIRRLLDRLPAATLSRIGDRAPFYERQDGELGLVAEYDDDANVQYLLRRLRTTAERFRTLFASDAEFGAWFPPVTARTDLAAAAAQAPAAQLSLFG